MSRIFLAWLICAGSFIASGQEIRAVTWKTELAADPAYLSVQQSRLLPLAQLALKSAPSELALFQAGGGEIAASLLGIPANQSRELSKTIAAYCEGLSQKPLFANAPSALSFSCSPEKPTQGLATVYVPKKIVPETRRIVFLHGYGGSALPLLASIIEAFPEAVVFAPAYGITGQAPGEYIDEALAATAKDLTSLTGIEFDQKPLLIGLSAGGSAGFNIVEGHGNSYCGYICLASFPQKAFRNPRNIPIRILCGGEEYFVKNGTLYRQTSRIPRGALQIKLLAGADHFFLLERKDETTAILRQWAK